MKSRKLVSVLFLFVACNFAFSQTGAIRLNQLGYYPDANKFAVVVNARATQFEIVNTQDSLVEFTGSLGSDMYWTEAGDSVKRCDFSVFTKIGTFKLRIPGFGESYPFEISNTILRKAAYASLKSFYYQRSSYELKAPFAGLWARAAGHPDTQCILHASTGKSGRISSPGGWYDAGDYGKYVINAGISVATLLSFYENFNSYFPDNSIHIPESGNGQNDLLDEVKFELDWLKTMQDDDGGVFFKLTTLSFSGFIMPSADKADRYVIGKTTASALDFAAMMAMAGRIYAAYDSAYAADCIVRAEDAWAWAKAHPAIYFKNPSDVSTGEYGDGNVSDEFIWAAAELYISTQKAEYKTYLEGKSGSLKYQSAPGWPSVQPLASLSLSTRPNGLSESLLATIKSSIVSTADKWLTQIASSPCRIPQFGFNWGSNSQIANQGVGLLYAYLITKDTKYIKGAAECADYLLGKNATGYSFESLYGYKTPMNFHHRPSYSDGVVQPVPGFVSGGPNPGQEDGQKYPFDQPAKSFIDVMGSYASNEVCINWNSPMTALFAGVDAVLGNESEAVEFGVETTVNNPPALTVSAPTYDAKMGSDQPLKVKGTATDPDGISKVELYIDSRFFAATDKSPFEFDLGSLPYGNHTATVLAYDSKLLTVEKTNKFTTYAVSMIPGKVEAENYLTMSGVSTQTTTDADGGLQVSSLDVNDYLDYSLNIQKSGTYRVEFRLAGSTGSKQFEIRKATGAVLSSTTFNATGSQKWITVADTLNLTAGKQTLRLQSLSAGWLMNWISFEYLDPTANQPELAANEGNFIAVFPNPVISDFRLQYRVDGKSSAQFLLIDAAGKPVESRSANQLAKASGELFWTPKAPLAPGEYVLILLQDGLKKATCRFIKTK